MMKERRLIFRFLALSLLAVPLMALPAVVSEQSFTELLGSEDSSAGQEIFVISNIPRITGVLSPEKLSFFGFFDDILSGVHSSLNGRFVLQLASLMKVNFLLISLLLVLTLVLWPASAYAGSPCVFDVIKFNYNGFCSTFSNYENTSECKALCKSALGFDAYHYSCDGEFCTCEGKNMDCGKSRWGPTFERDFSGALNSYPGEGCNEYNGDQSACEQHFVVNPDGKLTNCAWIDNHGTTECRYNLKDSLFGCNDQDRDRYIGDDEDIAKCPSACGTGPDISVGTQACIGNNDCDDNPYDDPDICWTDASGNVFPKNAAGNRNDDFSSGVFTFHEEYRDKFEPFIGNCSNPDHQVCAKCINSHPIINADVREDIVSLNFAYEVDYHVETQARREFTPVLPMTAFDNMVLTAKVKCSNAHASQFTATVISKDTSGVETEITGVTLNKKIRRGSYDYYENELTGWSYPEAPAVLPVPDMGTWTSQTGWVPSSKFATIAKNKNVKAKVFRDDGTMVPNPSTQHPFEACLHLWGTGPVKFVSMSNYVVSGAGQTFNMGKIIANDAIRVVDPWKAHKDYFSVYVDPVSHSDIDDPNTTAVEWPRENRGDADNPFWVFEPAYTDSKIPSIASCPGNRYIFFTSWINTYAIIAFPQNVFINPREGENHYDSSVVANSFLHEMGHSIGRLDEEYAGMFGTAPPGGVMNCVPSCSAWSGYGDCVSGGCDRWPLNVRPSNESVMKSNNSNEYNVVSCGYLLEAFSWVTQPTMTGYYNICNNPDWTTLKPTSAPSFIPPPGPPA